MIGRDMQIFALSAFGATFGLAIIFLVLFPVLVHGLLGFIAVQVVGERAENQAYAAGLGAGDDERV
jgi:hypothetical protein